MLKFQTLALVAFATACTAPLPPSRLQEFSQSMDKVVAVVAAPSRLQAELIHENAESRALCSYLTNGTIDLVKLKPPKPSQIAREQAIVAGALARYAKALLEVADGKSFTELNAAVDQFTTSTGALQSALGGTSAATATIQAGLKIAARLDESSRHRRIREVMEAVLPALFQLETRIRKDAPIVIAENHQHLQAWDRNTACVLRAARRDPSLAVPLYQERRADRARYSAQAVISNRAVDAITRLKQVHLLIVTDEQTNFLFATQQLKSIYQDLIPLIEAIESQEG